jgi:uroporphyrinogen-III synthase
LLHLPMIELVPLPLEERVKILQQELAAWDGLTFPSSPAVHHTLEAVMALGDVRLLAGKQLLAVGPLTAGTLREYGLQADGVAEGFGGAAALAELPDLKPGTYGYLTSDQSPVDKRQAALKPVGITLDARIFYRNLPTKPDHLPGIEFDRVLFTSGSTVRAYFQAFPEEISSAREWLAVGTSTLKAIEALGQTGRVI